MLTPTEFAERAAQLAANPSTERWDIRYRAVITQGGGIALDPRIILDYGARMPLEHTRAIRNAGWKRGTFDTVAGRLPVYVRPRTAQARELFLAATRERARATRLRMSRAMTPEQRAKLARNRRRAQRARAWLAALDRAIARPRRAWRSDMRGVVCAADGTAYFRGKGIRGDQLIHHPLIVAGIRARGFESARKSITKNGRTRNVAIYRRPAP